MIYRVYRPYQTDWYIQHHKVICEEWGHRLRLPQSFLLKVTKDYHIGAVRIRSHYKHAFRHKLEFGALIINTHYVDSFRELLGATGLICEAWISRCDNELDPRPGCILPRTR